MGEVKLTVLNKQEHAIGCGSNHYYKTDIIRLIIDSSKTDILKAKALLSVGVNLFNSLICTRKRSLFRPDSPGDSDMVLHRKKVQGEILKKQNKTVGLGV